MNQPDIFVFGSNFEGIHGKGAALFAKRFFGAVQYEGIGHFGNSYAIPTKSTPYQSLSLNEIKEHIEDFLRYAKENEHLTFQVTRIGCGLAGFSDDQIRPLFKDRSDNVLLSYRWLKQESPDLEPRVIIAGGRDFNDYPTLKSKSLKILEKLPNATIVSGGAKGADNLGQRFAKEHQLGLTVVPADWNRFGKASGMVRNELMAWQSSHLIAFWDGLSKGTQNMIKIAQREEMPYRVVNYTPEIEVFR